MCLAPRNILNPSKRFSQQGGQHFQLAVPCGCCAECAVLRNNEYYLRSYYHTKHTLETGGYVYFDTLTYSNDNLPRVSKFLPLPDNSLFDFPCFDRSHIRHFMVRLRRSLSRQGYAPEHRLTYFLTSEYGSDPRYTHRPHYHVLFYVAESFVPSDVLAQCVKECWPYGITDDVHRLEHVYTSSSDPKILSSAIQYVSKYVNKSSALKSMIRSRCDALYNCLSQGVSDASFLRKIRHDATLACSEFHLQSKGFGLSALDYLDEDDIFQSGLMKCPHPHLVELSIPVPTYFKRKLFYQNTLDFRSKHVWTLTQRGIAYNLLHHNYRVATTASRYSDFVANLDKMHVPNSQAHKENIYYLLGNRTWDEFARYLVSYKGRIINPFKDVTRTPHGTTYHLSEDVMLFREHFIDYFADGETFWYNYYTVKGVLDLPCLTNRNLGTCELPKLPPVQLQSVWDFKSVTLCDELGHPHTQCWSQYKNEEISGFSTFPLDEFVKHCVVSDKMDERFLNFDILYSYILRLQYFVNQQKQQSYDKKQELKALRKAQKRAGLLTS